jgi:hypothetical protein
MQRGEPVQIAITATGSSPGPTRFPTRQRDATALVGALTGHAGRCVCYSASGALVSMLWTIRAHRRAAVSAELLGPWAHPWMRKGRHQHGPARGVRECGRGDNQVGAEFLWTALERLLESGMPWDNGYAQRGRRQSLSFKVTSTPWGMRAVLKPCCEKPLLALAPRTKPGNKTKYCWFCCSTLSKNRRDAPVAARLLAVLREAPLPRLLHAPLVGVHQHHARLQPGPSIKPPRLAAQRSLLLLAAGVGKARDHRLGLRRGGRRADSRGRQERHGRQRRGGGGRVDDRFHGG